MDTNLDSQIFDDEPYADYEALFDPVYSDRRGRRKRSLKVFHQPKVTEEQIFENIVEEIDWDTQFHMSYKPSKHEAGWLLGSLSPFFEQSLISDVLTLVKGGKEASVYCCAAHSTMEEHFLAAKVYRPKRFRGLTNDKIYREGRDILTSDGHVVHENKDRVIRAIGKKTSFGEQVSHTSWLMHEYKALETLYEAGGNTPKPYAAGSNAILMTFIGLDLVAAPMLNTIQLEKNEAKQLFDLVLKNVELMLEHELIHADLSAYNILYLQGKIMIIDFPQVVDPNKNRNAPAILARDIQRICDYFLEQGVDCDSEKIYKDLWQRYLRVPTHLLRADESRLAQLYPEIFGNE
jgi:RIO kinase 1